MVTLRKTLARLLFALLAIVWASPGVLAQTVDPRDAVLEVLVEELPERPYEQEMILLTIRGYYKVTIALQNLKQPELTNFGWMQLGRDSWYDTMVDGRQVRAFERRLAVFPQADGRLEIGPFVHELTLIADDGTRFRHDVASKPVFVDVRPKPETVNGWWLPARSLTLTDIWSTDPGRLENGETATRTVTIEAVGVPPQFLPPAPPMRAPWLISFVDPEKRSTELTPEGPVSRVEWRWRMRPSSSEPAELEDIVIPWFDTSEREPRELVLEGSRIAFIGNRLSGDGARSAVIAVMAAPLAGLAGFLAGLGLLLPGLAFKTRAELLVLVRRLAPDRDALLLRRAAWAGDAAGARSAARRLLDGDRIRGRRARSEAEARLGALDRHLFAPDASGFDVRSFARDFLRLRGAN